MSKLTFGNVNFDRSSIPENLQELSAWPSVDLSALDEADQSVFTARRRAIELYVESPQLSLSAIKKATGVDPKTIYRIISRCLEKHADGRIYGFRAAIPYARLKQYERVHSANRHDASERSGLSGAFGLLLQQYPPVEKFLQRQAKQRHRAIGEASEVRKSMKRIHKGFLEECRKAGVKPNEYPLNRALAGLRSLASYLKRYDHRTFESAARSMGVDRVGPAAPADTEPAPPATRAFEVVEFDGHKIDLRVTVRVIDPFGFETLLELTRIWILVLLDLASRAVIGYKVALSKEYNKDDVASALEAALTPHRPRQYKIPGLAVRQGGGYPSAILPETQFACWEWFRFDGAKSHLASDTLARLNQIVGCWPDNGPPAEPDERPYIERFFQLIAENFAHRLPGTTGSSPKSIERALSDPHGDTSLLVELDELEDMIEVLIADYNGESHGGISNRTPLEAMAQLLARDKGYLRTLPRVVRQNLCLLQEARVVTIKGSIETGVRPHINFLEVRYTNDILSSSPALIGKKLRIYFDVRDIRSVRAFFEDGAELGVLAAARPWCYTPHSLRVRQEIFRLKRKKKLSYREGDDPVEAWEKYKRAQAKTNKRAATDLAKAKMNRTALTGNSQEQRAVTDLTAVAATSAQPVVAAIAQSEVITEVTAAPQPRVLKIKRTITF
jgi:putative transposase